MKLHPTLFEPETHSTLFLSINLISFIASAFILHAWPLSILRTVVYLGFVLAVNRRLASGRSYRPIQNLRGRTVIVTGAATGIGRVCALQFAKLGARVIIGVRGQERAERVARELTAESNGGTVIGHDLDLASLTNVKSFAKKINRVDVLVNNAGALQPSFLLTIDGIETQFATNHVGHFYLTRLLLPLLIHGRIVNVSSLAHHFVGPADIDYSFSALQRKYNAYKAYGLSKIAQIYHASELTRRHGVKAYSLHPGTILSTNLSQHMSVWERMAIRMFSLVNKTMAEGAMTSLFCALSDDAQPGHFHSNCQVREPSDLALDKQRAEECWNECERLIAEKAE